MRIREAFISQFQKLRSNLHITKWDRSQKYPSLSFDKGMYSCNTQSYQDIECLFVLIPVKYNYPTHLHQPHLKEQLSNFYHHRMVSSSPGVNINGITQCALLYIWLISLSIIFLSFIHVAVCVSRSFLLNYLIELHSLNIPFIVYSSS